MPGSFAELRAAMRMLPAFAASFALLLLVWQEHRAFFKRFGTDDGPLLWLNGALLFVVLAYVYPLKFLMNLLLGPDGFFAGRIPPGVAEEDVPSLMVMYGLGFVLLFAVLAAMHWRAAAVHRRAGVFRRRCYGRFASRAAPAWCTSVSASPRSSWAAVVPKLARSPQVEADAAEE